MNGTPGTAAKGAAQPATLASVFLVATRRGSSTGLPGLLSGLGVPLLYVASSTGAARARCARRPPTASRAWASTTPWWWLAAGVVVLLAGVVVGVGVVRQRQRNLQ
ncbi:hypothetical protein [Streptomyces sp. NPDC003247]|uniref:hypothetical protein n=1 Tax=Streptomyces sp. NPDC003247 TaxID=3364677 RepID=UPI0036923838